ncbi:ABC transporter ATP-binding protein [Psychromarinibacter halotolerans]|uniref:ABC transporter ATP-binding protein n=1 Tax=Psychromarinibacter halotolerans TaxID=1775175 RepID=A0ABV7GWQ4_9RHOB|nr:ABC transporter ATP-binding protein [Psychromarinibacter halotolerans]MDF0595267.1 ABC transporter ATP-binding protein [Psychromarinibacter halotolerans]
MTGTIEARGVDVVFTSGIGGRVRKAALSDVSLSVGGAQPSITAVVGESGSGKTTLTRLLLGFQSATSGEVLYNGQPMNALSGSDLRTFRRDVQAIFQDPFEAFNPFYKVEHPLVTPLRTFGLARSRDEALHLVEQAMETVGLRPQETIGKYPHQLSGGQRQRIMIARSLALRPSVILADEPVSMVDASLRSTILEMLWKLNRDQGIALIYVTHDLTTAYQVAETILVLYGGQIMEIGAAEEVIHRPRHPYTRALIDAVPSPDPSVDWNLGDGTDIGDTHNLPDGGCPFAPRCASAHDRCRAERPPLFDTDPLRASACWLDETDAHTTGAEIQRRAAEARAAVAAE